jgi:hypothetical protein
MSISHLISWQLAKGNWQCYNLPTTFLPTANCFLPTPSKADKEDKNTHYAVELRTFFLIDCRIPKKIASLHLRNSGLLTSRKLKITLD